MTDDELDFLEAEARALQEWEDAAEHAAWMDQMRQVGREGTR